MKFSKGAKVLAKWPLSNIYYKGVVLDSGNKEYKVKFEEGSEYVVDEKFVKKDNPKSPKTKKKSPSRIQNVESSPPTALARRAEGRIAARKASPSRKASPARKASPGRKAASPSRKASPARKASPSRRKSPDRPTRITERQKSTSTTPEKTVLEQLNDRVLRVVLDEDVRKSIERANSAIRHSVERGNSAVKSLTESSLHGITKTSLSNITMRKSTRVLSLKAGDLQKDLTPTPERSSDRLLRSRRELTPLGIVKSTVLENILEKTPEPAVKKYREFGGWLGALFWLLFTPTTTMALLLYARELRGGKPVLEAACNWKTFVDLEVAVLGLGFVLVQAVLALLPIGRNVDGLPDKQGRLRYRCNAFWNCLLTLAAVGGLQYWGYPVTKALDKLVPLFVTGQLLGLLVSVALFLKGGRAPVVALNPHGNSGIKIYDFFMGREINPRVGPWDVKMTLLNAAVIGTVVLDVLVVLRGLETGRERSPTLMLAVGMQLLYYADFLWHQSALLSSFEVMYEGTGAMAVLGYAIMPFFSTLITVHILDHKVQLHYAILASLCLIHTIGYVVYRASNNQKNEFRKNPLHPALKHLETIATTRGRKLLASGWWGWVRHPNYLGDLLITWTWGFTAGTSHWLPYVVPITVTLFILHRLLRNEARCHQRYNSAWELYCRRVPARLVPKVF